MIKFTKEEKKHILARVGMDISGFDTMIHFYGRMGDPIAKDYKKAKEEYMPFYKKVKAWLNEAESTTKD